MALCKKYTKFILGKMIYMAGEISAKDVDRLEECKTPMGTIYVAIGEKAERKLKSSKQLLGTWDLAKCVKVDTGELRAYIFTDSGVDPIIYDFVVSSEMKHIDRKNSEKMKDARKWFKDLTKKLYKDYDNQGGSIFEYLGPRIDPSRYRG